MTQAKLQKEQSVCVCRCGTYFPRRVSRLCEGAKNEVSTWTICALSLIIFLSFVVKCSFWTRKLCPPLSSCRTVVSCRARVVCEVCSHSWTEVSCKNTVVYLSFAPITQRTFLTFLPHKVKKKLFTFWTHIAKVHSLQICIGAIPTWYWKCISTWTEKSSRTQPSKTQQPVVVA